MTSVPNMPSAFSELILHVSFPELFKESNSLLFVGLEHGTFLVEEELV